MRRAHGTCLSTLVLSRQGYILNFLPFHSSIPTALCPPASATSAGRCCLNLFFFFLIFPPHSFFHLSILSYAIHRLTRRRDLLRLPLTVVSPRWASFPQHRSSARFFPAFGYSTTHSASPRTSAQVSIPGQWHKTEFLRGLATFIPRRSAT